MPSFNTDVPHSLGQEAAIQKLKGFLDRVKESYKDQVKDLSESWDANVLTFAMKTYGMKISGTMTVDEEKVGVAGSIPIAAMMFKGKIQDSITAELKKVLAS